MARREQTRWSESAGWLIGGAIIAFALYQSHRRPDYDPSSLIATGVSVITLTWAAPTQPIDDRISRIVTRDPEPLPPPDDDDRESL